MKTIFNQFELGLFNEDFKKGFSNKAKVMKNNLLNQNFNFKNFFGCSDKFGTIVASGSYVINSQVINFLIQELINNYESDELKIVAVDRYDIERFEEKIDEEYLSRPIIKSPEELLIKIYGLIDYASNIIRLLDNSGVKNVDEYNKKFGGKVVRTVLVIPEFKDVLDSEEDDEIVLGLIKLSKLAKRVNISLIVGTRSVDVLAYSYRFRSCFENCLIFKGVNLKLLEFLSYGKLLTTDRFVDGEFYCVSADENNGRLFCV
jgi:hypothetical protein